MNEQCLSVTTESSWENDQSQLRVTSLFTLEQGLKFTLESIWSLTENLSDCYPVAISLRINGVVLGLPSNLAVNCHRRVAREAFNISVSESSSTERTNERQTGNDMVYLATRHDGYGVFLDEISASVWGGTNKVIKKVNVDTAAFVLKADRNSVIESAKAATRETWDAIEAMKSVLVIADHIREYLRETDGLTGLPHGAE